MAGWAAASECFAPSVRRCCLGEAGLCVGATGGGAFAGGCSTAVDMKMDAVGTESTRRLLLARRLCTHQQHGAAATEFAAGDPARRGR